MRSEIYRFFISVLAAYLSLVVGCSGSCGDRKPADKRPAPPVIEATPAPVESFIEVYIDGPPPGPPWNYGERIEELAGSWKPIGPKPGELSVFRDVAKDRLYPWRLVYFTVEPGSTLEKPLLTKTNCGLFDTPQADDADGSTWFVGYCEGGLFPKNAYTPARITFEHRGADDVLHLRLQLGAETIEATRDRPWP